MRKIDPYKTGRAVFPARTRKPVTSSSQYAFWNGTIESSTMLIPLFPNAEKRRKKEKNVGLIRFASSGSKTG